MPEWQRICLTFVAALVVCSWAATASAQASQCLDTSPRANKHYVTTDLNLRAWPSTRADVLVTLPKGEIVYAFRERSGWSTVNVASLNITGYVATRYLTTDCIDGGGLTRHDLSRANVTAILMTRSLASYSGSCPCPYNTDRAGRRCGGRSAYSRPGGASPLCYSRDVSEAMINRFRQSR